MEATRESGKPGEASFILSDLFEKFGRHRVDWRGLVDGWGMLWGSSGAWGTWGMHGNAPVKLGDG